MALGAECGSSLPGIVSFWSHSKWNNTSEQDVNTFQCRTPHSWDDVLQRMSDMSAKKVIRTYPDIVFYMDVLSLLFLWCPLVSRLVRLVCSVKPLVNQLEDLYRILARDTCHRDVLRRTLCTRTSSVSSFLRSAFRTCFSCSAGAGANPFSAVTSSEEGCCWSSPVSLLESSRS